MNNTVTIQSLEIRLNVEGESDEQVFARYFERHIRAWKREQEQEKLRTAQAERERSLNRPGEIA